MVYTIPHPPHHGEATATQVAHKHGCCIRHIALYILHYRRTNFDPKYCTLFYIQHIILILSIYYIALYTLYTPYKLYTYSLYTLATLYKYCTYSI